MQEKKCTLCQDVKPATDFYKSTALKSGLSSWCKACTRARNNANAAQPANRTKAIERARNWDKTVGVQRRLAVQQSKAAMMPAKDPSVKFCPACRVAKDVNEFARSRDRYDGLQGHCKECQRSRGTQQREAARLRGLLPLVSEKFCPQCQQTKPAKDFSKSAAKKDGLFWCCKLCSQATVRTWAKTMPLKSRLKVRQYCAAYNATKKAVTVGKVDYYAIAVRDDFTCHLCGSRVEVGEQLHFDHVIPVSKGGPHSMENIKVSCAPCNLKKSDLLMEDFKRLAEAA